jgi:ABC-type multidrug transport system fused ATPase/permease subunit
MNDLLRFLDNYDRATRRRLVVAMMASVLLAVFDFLSLVLLYPIFSEVSGQASSASGSTLLEGDLSLQALLSLALACLVGRSLLGFAIAAWWSQQAARAEVSFSSQVFHSYAFAPYAFHLRNNSSELMARAISHVNMATATGLSGFVTIATDLAMVMGMSAALIVASPGVALTLGAALIGIGVGIGAFTRRAVGKYSRQLSDEIGGVYAQATTVLRGIRELTVGGGRDAALLELRKVRSRMVVAQRNLVVVQAVPRVVLEVTLYSCVLISLAWLLKQGDATASLPLVGLYIVALLRMLPAVGRILSGQAQIRNGIAMADVMRNEQATIAVDGDRLHRDAGDLPTLGDLAVRDVDFRYQPTSSPVLDAVTVTIPRGHMVGLAGESGSGKTTLLSLMLGLLTPTAGQITYGGADIGVADQRWLDRVAYVPQDVFVVDDTLLANVALGDDDPDREKALNALRRAHLGLILEMLEDGLDTQLQESGTRLSVGQRQRLAIARALYRDARVLFLDEPTAALDLKTEQQVMSTLKELRGDVTMIVVAHRLSTLEGLDAVYVLDAGRLSEAEVREGRLYGVR